MEKLISVQIETKEGINVVSSRIIAEQLGKRHDHVLRDLEKILKDGVSPKLGTPSIIENYYTNEQNKQTYKEYLLTKDGFTLYMFNIQGYNDFKMAYINAFNEMERALREMQPKLPTYAEALRQLADKVEENERLQLENTEMKPKAEFYDAVTDSRDTFDMAAVAKVLNMGIGRTKLFQLLRDKKVFRHNNEPYQKYVDDGWFRQIETQFNLPNGDTKIYRKTVVFQKGLEGIRKILKQK